MRVDGIEVEITHPDRVLFPADGITKADLAAFYASVAPAMLRHVHDRPLNMQRFPRGIDQPGFVQQEAPPTLPHWVKSISVEKEGGETRHLLCDNAATLVWLANLSCVTPHMWLSHVGTLDRPDRMVFDLDPAQDDFEPVRDAAKLLKQLLDERGLPAFLMTTGSRGLHVTIPLEPVADHDTVRDFSQSIAAELVSRDPKRLTTEIQKEGRGNKLFVDTLRNAYAHTAVAPYAVRARDGAPVAAPVRWSVLDDPAFNARRFRLRDFAEWSKEAGTAWEDFEVSSVRIEGLTHRTSQ